MTLHGKSIVAGRIAETTGPAFRASDRTTGAALAPEFFEALPADVDAAANAAASAFAEYRAVAPETRARLLEAIASEIEALGDALLQRCHLETGLPLARLQGERGRTCSQLRLFAQVVREGSWVDARIDPALPARQPLPRPDLRRMLQPIGPVAVFGASNFPLAFSVAGGDTASALAAGCPIVFKAHPAHPGTCELVGGAVTRAVASVGLPGGLFSLLHGGAAIGGTMVRHPAITAVGFTGSHGAGRALFDAAAARPRPIPVFAEMSSVNPMFLLPRALAERGAAIAQGLVTSFTLGTGQFCTKPGLVFAVEGGATTAFLGELDKAVASAPAGVMLTRAICESFKKGRDQMLTLPGVTLRASATTPAGAAGDGQVAVLALTTGADFFRTPALAHEVFGPFAILVVVKSADEMLACSRALEGQLTATLHGTPDDFAESRALLAELEQRAGRLLLNGFPTGVEVSPAMNHGGPYPATTDVRFTSVGTAAMLRFARPVCYQGFPAALLPEALRDENPLGLLRLVDGRHTRDPVAPPHAASRVS